MKLHDTGKLWVNQGLRQALCIAVDGDRALVEYDMPNGRSYLLSVPIDADFAEWSWAGVRNVSQAKPPARWRQAVAVNNQANEAIEVLDAIHAGKY